MYVWPLCSVSILSREQLKPKEKASYFMGTLVRIYLLLKSA